MKKIPLISQVGALAGIPAKIKKPFIGFLAFSLFFTQVLGFLPLMETETAHAAGLGDFFGDAFAADEGEVKEVYDVVALVVEEDFLEEDIYSEGLIGEYPDKLADVDTMEKRVMRFAEDLQRSSPMTVVEPISYDPAKHTLLDVITALENLYKNGVSEVESRLRGVILVGEIPLPVVNKNGNRFISMYPLTDFDDKAYVFNPSTKSFDRNNDVSLPKPEIWHGVLKAPQLDDDTEVSAKELDYLASFFDKNHLYHSGVDDFAKFQRKMFFADFVREDQSLNEDIYKLYQNFVKHMDDLVYMRFNKHWAQSLYSTSMGEMTEDLFSLAPSPGEYPAGSKEQERAEKSEEFKESLSEPGDMFSKLPDIYSKDLIERFHKQYVEVVSKYLSVVNDLAGNTGRYAPGGTEYDDDKALQYSGDHDSSKNGVDSVPALISMKDKLAQQYLRRANDAVELKVNDMVEQMAEPVQILDYTKVTGQIKGKPFEIKYKEKTMIPPPFVGGYPPYDKIGDAIGDALDGGGDALAKTMTLTEADDDSPIPDLLNVNTPLYFTNHYFESGKLFVNGIAGSMLTSPKQFFPYLGTMYEAGSSDYSVLTRSIRTDNVMDSTSTYTLGVNGLTLSPSEASDLTGGEYDYGFIVEANPTYGVPAFFNNSPLKDAGMTEGDIILGTRDTFVIDGFDDNTPVGDVTRHKPLEECDLCKQDGPKHPECAAFNDMCLPDEENPLNVVKSSSDFYDAVNKFAKTVGNSKQGGDDEDKIYWDKFSKFTVIYYDASKDKVATVDIIFDDFVPYSTLAYNDDVYEDNWLNGCYFISTILHDDRCFARSAKYPVLDPAGSFEPYHPDHTGVYTSANNAVSYHTGSGARGELFDPAIVVYEHQFPIGTKVIEQNPDDGSLEYSTHFEMFQKPAGRDFSEIDDIYVDAAFNFLPSGGSAGLSSGLDWKTTDLYSWTIKMMDKFGNKEGKKNQNMPYGGSGRDVPDIDTTHQFVLNGDGKDLSPPSSSLTLGDFAEYFGLYDGIDNDGDGYADFILYDLDDEQEGYDAFQLDLDEAAPEYGIDPRNIYQVSRFLLGKRYKYKNPPLDEEYTPNIAPVDQESYYYPLLRDMEEALANPNYNQVFDINNEIILKVTPHVYVENEEEKKISSLILHNEPTNYTIGKQVEAGMTQSLPTDDPRYVAFMDIYGDMQKVIYPNLFQSGSHAQFVVDIDIFADELLKMPGAEKLPKLNGSTKEYIKNEILSATTASNSEVYKTIDHVDIMESANSEVLKDSLNWNASSIDDKHEYVLKYYLNDGEDYDPFIHDPGLGYETAYMVFDGGSTEEGDYIDTSFNRDGLEETDPTFDPFAAGDYESFTTQTEGEDENEKKDKSTKDKIFEYVGLSEFFKELKRFGEELKDLIVHFDDQVEMGSACGTCFDDCESETLDTLILEPSKPSLYSDGVDTLDLLVTGFNSKEGYYKGEDTASLEIIISQDDLHPVIEVDEADLEKSLEKGQAVYKLHATKNAGEADISVVAKFSAGSDQSNVASEEFTIASSGKRVDLLSDSTVFTAGSDEEIVLTARLLADEQLETTATNQVTFSVIKEPGESNKIQFVGGNVVNAVNGVAEVTLKPLTKAGLVKIQADVTNGPFYAVGEKDLAVEPDEAYKVGIYPDTDVLEANGESKANITFKLYDQYENLLSTSFEKIAVFVFGDAMLESSKDQNPVIPGIQLNVNEGQADLALYSKEKIGEANVYAVYLSYDLEGELVDSVSDGDDIDFTGVVGTSKSFTVLGDTKLQLVTSQLEIDADGLSTSTLTAQLTKTNGEVLTGYNGPVSVIINDPSLAGFLNEPPTHMNKGKIEFPIQSTTKSGTIDVEVSVPGFAKNTITITTLPGDPVKLELTSDEDTLFANSVSSVDLHAILLDQYDNVAYLDSAPVIFNTTTATSHLIEFDSDSNASFAVNGYANIPVKTTGNSGKVNLFVESPGLEKGVLSLDIKKRINNFENFAPRVLYMNLLGAPFSDFGKDDLASSLLYNGKTQAISSTTANPNDKKRVLFVDGYGQIDLIDENIKSTVVNASDSFGFTRVKFYDAIFDEGIAEMFVVPKDGLPFVLLNGDAEEDLGNAESAEPADAERDDFSHYEEGVLVNKLVDSEAGMPEFVLSSDEKRVFIKLEDETLAVVDKFGRINAVSDEIEFRVPGMDDTTIDQSNFSILIGYRGVAIGQVMIKQDIGNNVVVLPATNKSTSFIPGIYLKLDHDYGKYASKSSFSRYSTEFLRGVYVVDMEEDLDSMMAPGFGFTSLEDASGTEGVGFSYDNKNMLLFAAGSSAGEANMPYASEVGILLGDPTVRIEADDEVLSSGYALNLGQMLHSEDAVVENMISFDYNGDGYDDLLLTLEDGAVRLLENEISNQKFKDRGILLQVPNGILSMAKIDIDNDDFDDLIIGSRDSCVKGERCLYLYKNNNGAFERQKLELNFEGKVYEILSHDLNNDDLPDIILSDSSGFVYIFWNEDGKIDLNGTKLSGFGLDINDTDLIDDVVIHYSGMPTQNTIEMTVQPDEPVTKGLETADNEPVTSSLFVLPSKDSEFYSSTKSATDLNGYPLGIGDTIQYKIELKNSGASVSGLILSDITPTVQKIDESSLKCLDVNCVDDLKWGSSDLSLRERVIKGISVPANGVRTITYEAVIQSTPKVSLNLGNFEIDGDDDEYVDILVRPESNPDAGTTYFYSDGLDDEGHVVYEKELLVVEEEPPAIELPIKNADEIQAKGVKVAEVHDDPKNYSESEVSVDEPDEEKDEQSDHAAGDIFDAPIPSEPPAEVDALMDELKADSDYDLIPDSWDDLKNAYIAKNIPEVNEKDQKEESGSGPDYNAGKSLNKLGNDIADGIETAIETLRCSGAGCLPIPYNYAFFVPSDKNPTGGYAALAILSNPPYVGFFYPTASPSVTRLYVSPTLTLGLGMALCIGQSPAGLCFITALPVSKLMSGMCDAIEKMLKSVTDAAKKIVTTVQGAATLLSDGKGAGGSSGSGDTTHNGSFGSASSKLTFQDSVNIRIPGFPSTITNWIDAQTEEIFNKLLDLPDFYIILPDFGSLFRKTADAAKGVKKDTVMNSALDFLNSISQIPLIQIEGKEVMVKIPMVGADQIAKWERQFDLFKKSMEEQWDTIKKRWTCDNSVEEKTICEAVSVKMTLFMSDVQKVLDAIESLKNLPKTIMELRTAEVKYATQLICYMDAIMELTGGYIKRQGIIIKSWMQAITDIIKQFRGWQALLNLSIDYQESCDKCKNERYGEIGLLLSLFAALPDLPVIPIPKWPNFVIDLSKMEVGIKVLWPDIVFKPQPIVLPDIPTINLPDFIPDITVDLDAMIPDFDISSFFPSGISLNLPDLPPLPLPKFPDLPRPPKIPKLPKIVFDLAASLKVLFKIICLIKEALIPFPEHTLKAEIEELTQPGVKPLLPLTIGLGMQLPEISYDAPVEIDITLRSKFGANTEVIYDAVKYAADWYNGKIEKYINEFNSYSRSLTLPDGITDLEGALREEFGIGPNWEIDGENIKNELQSSLGDDPIYYLAAEQDYIRPEHPMLNKDLGELDYVDTVQYIDDPYMSELAELRNSLLSYATGVSDSNELIGEMSDYEDLTRILVEADDDDKLNRLVSRFGEFGEGISAVSSAGDAGAGSGSGSQIISFPLVDVDFTKDRENLDDIQRRLLADAEDYNFTPDPSTEGLPDILAEGIYEFIPGETKQENVLSYTDELGGDVNILKSDVDLDGDDDIILSLGGDVYLKENYTKSDNKPTFKALKKAVSLDKYIGDEHLSIQGYKSTAENNGTANITFTPSSRTDVVGYEVAVIPSLIDMDKNTYNGTYRFYVSENAKEVYGIVDDVFGVNNSINSTEREGYSAATEFAVSGDDIIYALEDSGFILKPEKTDEILSIELDEGEFYTVPDNYPAEVKLSLINGDVELIPSSGEIVEQPLFDNSAFVYGNTIEAGNNGGAVILFDNGARTEIHENEIFEMIEVQEMDSPNIMFDIPNGNYYSVIYSLTEDGKRSFVSTQTPLSPQICGDDTAPFPALANPELSVSVMKTLTIDASASFDPSGEIMSYYVDFDLNVDTDGDGDPTNDPDIWSDLNVQEDGPDEDDDPANDKSNPQFNLPPFNEVGVKQIALNIVDMANNTSTQIITINVYVPNITLDPVDVVTAVVTGATDLPTDDMPITLMRTRYIARVEDGQLKFAPDKKEIITSSADKNGQYWTMSNGEYVIEDFNMENIIAIYDSDDNIIGEINTETGNFWLDEGYNYEIPSAQPPTESTKVMFSGSEITGPDGESMGSIYFVADGNIEVDLHKEMSFDADSVENMLGVHVSDTDLSDEFEFKEFPANDPNYPNGVYLYYNTDAKQVAAIDTSGNIMLLDDRMAIEKKENSYRYDPFVFELMFMGEKVAEVYVNTDGLFDELQVVGPDDVPRKFPTGVSPQYLYETEDLSPVIAQEGGQMEPPAPAFTDLSGDLYDYAMNLYYQGILAGGENFNATELISRADFVVMLIKMLCIIPREEAYDDPSLFSDIEYNTSVLPYFYSFVKEGALLGLVHGYGEENDTSTGLNPFKPTGTITIAEAAKIIVNGLDLIGAIDATALKTTVGGAWYTPYLLAAQNLNTYAKDEVTLKNSYIITAEEAQNPAKQLTRGDVLEMAFRVLEAYNCFELDKDGDGMSDYCENKYDIDDPNADPDEDELINNKECFYGLDPHDPDTDKGGVKDGVEIAYGTNPLYKPDDQNDTDGDGLLDVEELNVYKTDPEKWDTDEGGKSDGFEVDHQTNPLEYDDDYTVSDGGDDKPESGQLYDTEPGIYLVPPECTTCPCLSTFDYKADLRKGDVLYTIILNKDVPVIYSKSNEQKVF